MEEEPHINIDELYETKKKSDLNRLAFYIKLLKRVHNQIKMTARIRDNNQMCYFIMPEILIGCPKYDIGEGVAYIMDRLTTDGFITRYVHPNLIIISWNHWVPSYVREEIKNKTGQEVNQYGEIIENKQEVRFEKTSSVKSIKSGGTSVYDDDFINSMKSLH